MNDVTWETLDWDALDRLRAIFLSEAAPRGMYWTARSDLANYDFTFGRRIAWKWVAVLRELRWQRWTQPAGAALDWSCGSRAPLRNGQRGPFSRAPFTSYLINMPPDTSTVAPVM